MPFELGFVIPGASRSGTTTLHSLLGKHPGIFLPKRQEMQFFSHDANFDKGGDWYESWYRNVPRNSVPGDVSPPYFEYGLTIDAQGRHRWNPNDDAAARLRRLYPNVRVILTLRNPVERAYSQFWKNVWQGRESQKDFGAAVNEEMEGMRLPERTPLCWIYRNEYSRHVKRWVEMFGKDNVLILLFEEWTRDQPDTVRRISKFIGASEWSPKGGSMFRNPGRSARTGLNRLAGAFGGMETRVGRMVGLRPGYPKLDEDTRSSVAKILSEDRPGLEEIIDRPIQCWD